MGFQLGLDGRLDAPRRGETERERESGDRRPHSRWHFFRCTVCIHLSSSPLSSISAILVAVVVVVVVEDSVEVVDQVVEETVPLGQIPVVDLVVHNHNRIEDSVAINLVVVAFMVPLSVEEGKWTSSIYRWSSDSVGECREVAVVGRGRRRWEIIFSFFYPKFFWNGHFSWLPELWEPLVELWLMKQAKRLFTQLRHRSIMVVDRIIGTIRTINIEMDTKCVPCPFRIWSPPPRHHRRRRRRRQRRFFLWMAVAVRSPSPPLHHRINCFKRWTCSIVSVEDSSPFQVQFKDGTRPKTIVWGCRRGVEVCCNMDCCAAPPQTYNNNNSSSGSNAGSVALL